MTATDDHVAQILALHKNGGSHAPVIAEHQPVGGNADKTRKALDTMIFSGQTHT